MTVGGAHLVTAFLAAPPTPPPGKGAEWGKAAPIGLLILVLLGIALYLLIKSMNKHMRKVSGLSSFDTAADSTAPTTVHVGSESADTGLTDDASVEATTAETPGQQTPSADGR